MTPDLFEGFVLRWPPAVFRRRANELVRSTVEESRWRIQIELLLREAFATPSASLQFQNLMQVKSMPGFRHYVPAGQYLITLANQAEAFELEAVVSAYYSQRRANKADHRLVGLAAIQRLLAVIDAFEQRGYFALATGTDCVDRPRAAGQQLAAILEQRLGRPQLWPLDAEALLADLDPLLDVIEVLHEIVALPRDGYDHDFDDCGWHYTDFSVRDGRQIFRWWINRVLEASDLDLHLADGGEDRGRLVADFDATYDDLTAYLTARSDRRTGDPVRHALAQFRRRNASEHDKRTACVELAGVLESRRALLKSELLSKDEAMLFEIANRYAIRHQRDGQQGDYRPEFLDWVFWVYAATIELSDQLLAREQTPDEPA